MTLRSLAGTTALVLSLTSTGLLADVTPEDVWQAWQNASTAVGTTVTSESAVRDGDALVVSNVALSDGAGSAITLETVTFTDNGDGTVTVTLPDSFPIKLVIPATEGDATSTASDLTIDVNMPGTTIIASGTPDAMAYDADAPRMDLKADISDSLSTGTVEAELTGIQVHYTASSAEADSYQEDLSIKSAVITAAGTDTANSTDYALTAKMADFYSTIAVSMPKDSAADAFEVALAKGMTMTSQFGMGASTFDLSLTEAGAVTQFNVSLKDGMVDVGANAGKVSYYNIFNGLSVTATSPELPVANAAVSLGKSEIHVDLPVFKSDTPAEFTFLFNMTDLSFAEDIWAMIDPGAAFKHDPATVIVDTYGLITLAQDLTADATALTSMDPNAAGQLNALEVPNITLKAGGAELTAQGSFSFDYSDMTTFAGAPAPTGKLDVKATGVNALLDTLVAMGLVPQDQADQGRMMVAMFANTSATADEMTSTLEFKDKHFFANGQQLQ